MVVVCVCDCVGVSLFLVGVEVVSGLVGMFWVCWFLWVWNCWE